MTEDTCTICQRANHHEDCPNYSVTVEDMLYLDRLTRIPSPKNTARPTIGEE